MRRRTQHLVRCIRLRFRAATCATVTLPCSPRSPPLRHVPLPALTRHRPMPVTPPRLAGESNINDSGVRATGRQKQTGKQLVCEVNQSCSALRLLRILTAPWVRGEVRLSLSSPLLFSRPQSRLASPRLAFVRRRRSLVPPLSVRCSSAVSHFLLHRIFEQSAAPSLASTSFFSSCVCVRASARSSVAVRETPPVLFFLPPLPAAHLHRTPLPSSGFSADAGTRLNGRR